MEVERDEVEGIVGKEKERKREPDEELEEREVSEAGEREGSESDEALAAPKDFE